MVWTWFSCDICPSVSSVPIIGSIADFHASYRSTKDNKKVTLASYHTRSDSRTKELASSSCFLRQVYTTVLLANLMR